MNPQTPTAVTTQHFVDLENNPSELLMLTAEMKEITILYADLKNIYIKKNKFSLSTKIGLAFLLLILFSIATFTSHQEIALLQLMLSIPLFAKINSYKWYHLHLELYNGTLFSKRFYSDKKHYYIKTVHRAKSDLYYHQIGYPNQYKKHSKRESSLTDFSIPSLSIA